MVDSSINNDAEKNKKKEILYGNSNNATTLVL